MSKNIGLVGLGIMGSSFARNLLAKGFHVVGYDIDITRMEELEKEGLEKADSPLEVANKCQHVITSLPSPIALIAAIESSTGLASCTTKLTIADTGTLALHDKERALNILEKSGHILLDCPVSGTGAQAVNADLVILGSGDQIGFDAMKPYFAAIGRETHYLGQFGNGSRMKYVANLLVTIHNVSSAEAMAFGMKSGIAPETIYEVLKSSAGSSRMFEVRGPMMVRNEYDKNVSANFKTMAKDLSIISQFAQSIDCPTPLFSTAANIHSAAVAQGLEESDTASVCVVMEKLCGVDRSKINKI
tara:strand:+ start:492 stop:1397 length:906 start_codon:yes stop_codon:yes gene_type:complete